MKNGQLNHTYNALHNTDPKAGFKDRLFREKNRFDFFFTLMFLKIGCGCETSKQMGFMVCF